MQTSCAKCGTEFDDADQNTICPHPLIMSADDLAQKKAGLALIGRAVCFAHQPDGPAHVVQAVGWNGMVTLGNMVGEFAPHLFVLAKEPA